MKNTKIVKIIIVVVIAIILTIVAFLAYHKLRGDNMMYRESDTAKISYKNITSDEAKAELDKDSSIILLDVRTQAEYNQGHIPNSILIPLNELGNRALNELPNKQAKIFVYCRSGVRSASACGVLVGLGYTNVYNMGGIVNWKYGIE